MLVQAHWNEAIFKISFYNLNHITRDLYLGSENLMVRPLICLSTALRLLCYMPQWQFYPCLAKHDCMELIKYGSIFLRH